MRVQRFRLSELSKLEDSWRRLEHGEDMTVFQGFDWYRAVANHQRHERLSRLTTSHRIYAVHAANGKPLLIAPMRLHHVSLSRDHIKGIHFAGRGGSADYLNFVYSDFSPEALGLVLSRLQKEFPKMPFRLERVLSGTASHAWLSQWAASCSESLAVAIEVPTGLDAYQAMLSKSTRQNLRTARNRLGKDGIELETKFGGNPSQDDAEQFAELRSMRARQRRDRATPTGLKQYVHKTKRLLSSTLFTDLNESDLLMSFHQDAWHMQVRLNGRLVAYAFGFKEPWHSVPTIRITQVAYADDFRRYSPGLTGLHQFICQVAARSDTKQRRIDFTRGEEKYKFTLGGEAHTLTSFDKHG